MATTNKTNFWETLSPKRKQQAVIGLAVLGFGALAYMWIADGDGTKHKKKPRAIDNILTGADTRELGLSGMAKDLDQLRRDMKSMKEQGTLPKDSNGEAKPDPQIDEMKKQVDTLTKLVEEQRNNPPPTSPVGATPTPPTGTVWGAPNGQTPIGPAGNAAGASTKTPTRIYEIDSDADAGTAKKRSAIVEPRVAKAQSEKIPKVYLPRGAMMQGVTVTGLDAPTGRGSTQDPIPVLVRIKHEAILPNMYRADYRECFALLSGYGDLSSERAYLRSVGLSCVRSDGKVIDANIEMVAIGEDGKAGMRGRFVSKQGQAIAKAAIAGFAQSYAQALRPSGGFGYGGGQSQAFSGDQAENGFFGGASSALDRVSKFYIDYANQMFPVVEVDAGRPVTLVVVRGAELQVAAN